MINTAIAQLLRYAEDHALIQPADRVWAANALLESLRLTSWDEPDPMPDAPIRLMEVLDTLLDDAFQRGVLEENSVACRDRLDTALMGRLTPPPHAVQERFQSLYNQSPQTATDWFYAFAQDTNYIRRDRIAQDVHWQTQTAYGTMDITINLSKPERDPKAIAAAAKGLHLDGPSYPECQLCRENEGYPGRTGHPARQNLRVIPLSLHGQPWCFQYSPYVYYTEHCIVFSHTHQPMAITGDTFHLLLDFITQFPHYFLGSNADLPIVGGSILGHNHFQGGHYAFPITKAPLETELSFSGAADVTAGIVRWPMSTIRLRSPSRAALAALANRILRAWRVWSDPEAGILACTGNVPHNTITPVARRRGEDYELDLVLRNNLTTDEHPLGVYHPHKELHHIKRENIGLIEVMGLAVLPARLKQELTAVQAGLLEGQDLRANRLSAIHADWAEEIASRRRLTADNIETVLREETGRVFVLCLEQSGVYKHTPEGKAAFLHFLDSV